MVDGKSKRKQPFPTIPVDSVDFDEHNVRRTQTDISGLRQTISDVGLLQPILLRKSGEGYTVIDGERRLRAMRDLGISDLIVGRDVIIDVDETNTDVKFKQVIANVQREDINDVELGHAFVFLNEQCGYQLKEVADIIGKTPHYVTAKVGLAKRLSPEVQALYVSDIEAGKCNPVTSAGSPNTEDMPYVMSVKVVESISRMPKELQMPSYEAIKDKKMDKSEALRYLQAIRKNFDISADKTETDVHSSDIMQKEDKVVDDYRHGPVLKKYLSRIDKDIEQLTVKVKTGGYYNDREVIPVLESLINKLQSLYSEIKSGNEGPDSQVSTS